MALKKPSELFGKKGDNSKISENINGNLNNIKQQFDKVEELKRELEGVTSSIDHSLSEVVDNSINFVEFKEEYSELIDNLNTKIEGIKEDFDERLMNSEQLISHSIQRLQYLTRDRIVYISVD